MIGHTTGVQVGQIFNSRKELRASGVHGPLISGIWGAKKGAYSIVLSGGYEDDIDNLDEISYTGQDGQDEPGKRQIADKEFTKRNCGLQLIFQYQLPVRATLGHQIKYGLKIGYRYDGLYFVKTMNV